MTTAQQAVSGLSEAASTQPNRNNLGLLAQMHSWCQMLAEGEGGANPAASEALGLLARGLILLLERIILDEAADPVAGTLLIPEAVAAMKQAFEGTAVDFEPLLARIHAAANGAPVGQATQPVSPAAEAPPAPEPTPAPEAKAPASAPPSNDSPPAPVVPIGEPYASEPLVLDLSESEHLVGFLEEAAEHMDTIERLLLEVEENTGDTDKLNELFRPFHTIKGIAGFLNLRDINRLTHEIETILDHGRKGELRISTLTVDLIFTAVDTLKAQLAAIGQYMQAPTGGSCPQPEIAGTIMRLRAVAAGQGGAAPERPPLGQMLREEAAATEADVDAALELQKNGAPQRLGEILVAEGVTSPEQVKRALNRQQDSGKSALDHSIRVDTTKLDTLVDAVGELVIAQSMVSLSETIRQDEKLLRNVSQVSKIVRDIQETAMAMRMVPIGHTFQKMRRLVRDVARKAGKEVELTINGEETELDKNVIQQISDPLVHMVRNSVDHGIEAPDVRRKLGKPEMGTVTLDAYHQGDSIVIEVRDDGKGLDREKLIAKGIERGLVAPDEHLTEQEAFALILQPGFSTAEKITDISGRGVGMDVVKRNVEQLRGKIEIHSEKGRGSTFIIRLPLTLAIIDGMLVRVGTERMIIPTILIEQSLQPERKQLTSVQRRGLVVQVRGELCPVVQLGAMFGYADAVDPCENLLVIVQCEGRKVALVVEELIGQQQVVIKTLGERFKKVHGVSGAAILGDGRVGLILEPSGLLALHNASGCAGFVGTPTAERTGSEPGPAFVDQDIVEEVTVEPAALAAATV